jgi:sugar O-acyltransferase (sialic acid O-acetyltransferase NeuD family)
MNQDVVIPRVNANDDQVKIVGLFKKIGDAVQEGDLLAEIESTKATAEILAPHGGRVAGIKAALGDFVEVGTLLFVLSDQDPEADDADDSAAPVERHVTAKARQLAEKLGVDLDQVPAAADGRVTADAVQAFGGMAAKASPGSTGRTWAIARTEAIILGGRGHAAAVIEALTGQGITVIGCIDDDPAMLDQEVHQGVKVIGPSHRLKTLHAEGVRLAYVGVGGVGEGGLDEGSIRAKVFNLLLEQGFVVPPVVSRDAHVAPGVAIGPGSVVFPGAVVGAACRIGANVLINQGSQICHGVTIGDHAHITPGAMIGGNCKVGRGSLVGMGASVLLDVAVGDFSVVHNNAAITSRVPDLTEVYTDGRRFERDPAVVFD